MSILQQSYPKVQDLRLSSTLTVVSVPFSGSVLWCDSSTGILRPLVPETMRRLVFNTTHSVSHPGKRVSRRLILRCFMWEFLSRDVNLWAQSCLDCQRSKVLSHIKSSVHHIPVPNRRFTHIHVDLVGPLPESNGFSYLFTIIDWTSRWPEAVLVKSITAEECARAMLRHWIPLFGIPSVITSDRGSQFTSSIWSQLCSFLGIVHSPTASFHSLKFFLLQVGSKTDSVSVDRLKPVLSELPVVSQDPPPQGRPQKSKTSGSKTSGSNTSNSGPCMCCTSCWS